MFILFSRCAAAILLASLPGIFASVGESTTGTEVAGLVCVCVCGGGACPHSIFKSYTVLGGGVAQLVELLSVREALSSVTSTT